MIVRRQPLLVRPNHEQPTSVHYSINKNITLKYYALLVRNTEKIVFNLRIMLVAISSSSGDRAVMRGSIRPVCRFGTLNKSLSRMLASMRPLQENK